MNHFCNLISATFGAYGPAITTVAEHDDGTLWAGNEEYSTQVNYCPSCGYQAKTLVKSLLINNAFCPDCTHAQDAHVPRDMHQGSWGQGQCKCGCIKDL